MSPCTRAVRCIKHTLVDVWGFLSEEVMLTICDADTYFDTQFMDCLVGTTTRLLFTST